MGKLVIGSFMFVFGLFFLFTGVGAIIGIPLVAGGLVMGAAGMASLGTTAVKTGISVSRIVRDMNQPSQSMEAGPAVASAADNPARAVVSPLDNPAWKTLKEFDADIQQALAKLSGFGPKAEERLASAYLFVNDKGLLPSIVAKINADEEQNAIAREEEKARRAAEMSARERELLADRERKSEYTISRIKEVGMMHRGKKVVSAEMYYGETAADQGWAKIVYEDGKVELWAGSSWMEMSG